MEFILNYRCRHSASCLVVMSSLTSVSESNKTTNLSKLIYSSESLEDFGCYDPWSAVLVILLFQRFQRLWFIPYSSEAVPLPVRDWSTPLQLLFRCSNPGANQDYLKLIVPGIQEAAGKDFVLVAGPRCSALLG